MATVAKMASIAESFTGILGAWYSLLDYNFTSGQGNTEERR
jgi:hypothetical protein